MIFKKLPALFFLIVIPLCFITTGKTFASPGSLTRSTRYTYSSADSVPVTETIPRIFESVEKEAYFDGGEPAWHRYLEQNLNPNVPVINGAPPGTYTVIVQFVVSTSGKVSDVKGLTKHGFGMEAEVIRIIRKSPPWVPAVQDGHNVNAYRKQPVTFQISEEKKKKKKRDS
ncbi:MAG TPA: energy transducer TonB [Chitinophagaceae bacterium]